MYRIIPAYVRTIFLALICMVISVPVFAQLKLISPNEGQRVREWVKVSFKEGDIPPNGYMSIFLEQEGKEIFVGAFNPASAKRTGGQLVFYWNSKEGYTEPNNPKKLQFIKDGVYTMRVQIHNPDSEQIASDEVRINLRNTVARTSPAPPVRLVNYLSFGEVNTYHVKADASIYDRLGLPAAGGLGISSDFDVVQNVEDVRPDGEVLVRYRVPIGAYVNYFGTKEYLHLEEEIKPQIYRIVNKYGDVINNNLFKKQAGIKITQILPSLPTVPVKEGQSWREDSLMLKFEGMGGYLVFNGTSQVDGFEWQNGHRCAKIVHSLRSTSDFRIGSMIVSNGMISASGTTYFAYSLGKAVRREFTIDIPASISASVMKGAADASSMSSMVDDLGPEGDEDGPINNAGDDKDSKSLASSASSVGQVQIRAIYNLEK